MVCAAVTLCGIHPDFAPFSLCHAVKFLMDMGFPEDEMDWSYAPSTQSNFAVVCARSVC